MLATSCVGQLQRIVKARIADRSKIVHAGDRQSRGDARMIERHCDEVGAGRPAREHDGAGDAV